VVYTTEVEKKEKKKKHTQEGVLKKCIKSEDEDSPDHSTRG
jgi:hypothetical protein